MLINEVTYQSKESIIKLDNDYNLIYNTHPFEDNGNTWKLINNKTNQSQGEVVVNFYSQEQFPSVSNITMYVKGYGWKCIKVLVNFYGGLTSDPQGNTNDKAIAMWQRLGATKLIRPERARGFIFQLTKQDLI